MKRLEFEHLWNIIVGFVYRRIGPLTATRRTRRKLMQGKSFVRKFFEDKMIIATEVWQTTQIHRVMR